MQVTAMTLIQCAAFAVSMAVLVTGCGRADNTSPSAPADLTPAGQSPVPSVPPVGSPPPAPAASAAPDGQPGTNAQGAATLQFQNQIKAYMKIHNEAESTVPQLKRTDDPQEIADREAGLARAIQSLRAQARIGEVFAPEYQPYFIKIVQDDFARRPAVDRKALINELPKNMKVDINTVYPTSLALATFPAGLLRKLPDLPPELEYRLVGRSLILRDVKANLIVDILRDVVPTIPS